MWAREATSLRCVYPCDLFVLAILCSRRSFLVFVRLFFIRLVVCPQLSVCRLCLLSFVGFAVRPFFFTIDFCVILLFVFKCLGAVIYPALFERVSSATCVRGLAAPSCAHIFFLRARVFTHFALAFPIVSCGAYRTYLLPSPVSYSARCSLFVLRPCVNVFFFCLAFFYIFCRFSR